MDAPDRTADRTPVEIAAGRLQLRPFEPAHAGELLGIFTDASMAGMGTGISRDLAGMATYIARSNDWTADAVGWGVFTLDGRIAGAVALHHLDPDQGTAEVGYWTAPALRRRGVARDAVSACVRFGFGALGLRRLYLYHALDNEASCAVAAACGFAWEGTLRAGYRYPDGIVRDEHLHGRLADDPDPPVAR